MWLVAQWQSTGLWFRLRRFDSCPSTHEHVSERPKEAGCNPVIRWFESSRALQYGKVAQLVERRIEVPGVAGSSPAYTTTSSSCLMVK